MPERVEDLILDTQPKQELATITEEADENENNEMVRNSHVNQRRDSYEYLEFSD